MIYLESGDFMKRILIIILIMLVITGCGKEKDEKNVALSSNNKENIPSVNNENKNKNVVNLYLFHSNTCSHCQDEKAWLKSIESDYDYLRIHYYEVSENRELYNKVKEVLEISNNGVPLTIIGNDYYLGFSSARERKLIRAIEDTSEVEICDVIEAIINNKDYNSCKEENER